jgi:hypothetical protein
MALGTRTGRRTAVAAPGPGARRRRWRLGRISRPLRLVVGLTVAGVALSACLSPGYSYESHRSPDGTILYFKVPSSWTFYNAKQVIEAQNGSLSQSQVNQVTSGQWIETMSGSPSPTVKSSTKFGERFPTAVVEGRQLDVSERQQLSLSTMRAELLGVDPLNTQNGLVTRSGFQLLSYNEFTGSGGVRGVKFVVNIVQKGQPVKTFGQVVAVDPQTNWIFALGIGCKIGCWGQHSGLIDQVLNSWTLKEAKA